MLPERLRSIFRKENEPVSQARHLGGAHAADTARSFPSAPASRKPPKNSAPQMRPSRGLEQFFFNVRDVVGLSVLDCAGANQDNINFLINLGHKVYSQDLVRNLDEAFGQDLADQTNA